MDIAGYAASEITFAHGSVRLTLHTVARLEEIVDREALIRDDTVTDPPYWAHLWLGARALARFLAESAPFPEGIRVLDLGCGLGLPGLVAAARGADVTFADREAAALEFVRSSGRRNGLRARTLVLDFTRDLSFSEFDVILAAEIVYAPEAYARLASFLDRHLARGGVIHLTDAFRSDARSFFDELERLGFVGEQYARHEWEDGRPQGVVLWTFRRRPAGEDSLAFSRRFP